jgi:drug/metabolite transporter (DMT)-like permease
MLPAALPWLATLLLLVFIKPNRCPRAWWILAPVACLAWGIGFLPDLWPSMPSQFADILPDLVVALAFGVAAVWLLSPYLKSRFRILNILGFLLVLEAFGLVIFVFTQDWNETMQAVGVGVGLAVCAAIIPVAAGLAGLLCRRRYRPLVLSAGVLAMILSLWVLVMLPLFLIQTAAAGQHVPVGVLVGPVLAMTGLCFGVLLPFLLLSYANSLFRQRLVQLLRLAPELPPVIGAAAAPGTTSIGTANL